MKEFSSRSKKNWGNQKGLKQGKQLTELVVKGNARPVRHETRNTSGTVHPNAITEHIIDGEVIVEPSTTSKEPSASREPSASKEPSARARKPFTANVNHWGFSHEAGPDNTFDSRYNLDNSELHQQQAISAYQDNTSTRHFSSKNIFDEYA